MKNLILLAGLLLAYGFVHAQTWDGGGGDTEWNNPQNWDTNTVPLAGGLVVFSQTVAVTASGTVVTPAQILVRGANTELKLDLNITVGDGATSISAIQVHANARLIIPATRTLVLNPPMTANAINIGGGAINSAITIETGATVNIILANRGINLRSSSTVFTNHGTITIGQGSADGINLISGATFNNTGSLTIGVLAGGDGIDNTGTFDNTGSVTIVSADFKGIRNNASSIFRNNGIIDISDFLLTTADGIFSAGTFLNDTAGVIVVTRVTDDAVEVVGGTFTNIGTMSLTSQDAAMAANAGLSVGSGTATGTFDNQGILDINAGGGTNGRAISVLQVVNTMTLSTLSNSGLITLSGGSPTQRLYNRGITTNQPTGTINTGNGRVNVNLGTFINYGLLEGNYPTTPSVFTGPNGTSLNDGFYRHNNATFSNGGSSNITNNGVNMNDPAQTTFDLMGGCTVTVAGPGATQAWLNSLGDTIDPTGPEITFNDALPDTVMATIKASGIDVTLTVENVCSGGLLPIELLYFGATPLDKSVLLEWTTATELDNDYMAVERSTDARSFTEIGQIAGAGTSYTPISYELEDHTPSPGLNYYRLRQVDTDGTVHYSKIIAVEFQGIIRTPVLTIVPNPVRNGGNIEIDLSNIAAENNRYCIANGQGQIVVTYDLSGGSKQQIKLPNLPAGLYILTALNQPQGNGSRFLIIE